MSEFMAIFHSIAQNVPYNEAGLTFIILAGIVIIMMGKVIVGYRAY